MSRKKITYYYQSAEVIAFGTSFWQMMCYAFHRGILKIKNGLYKYGMETAKEHYLSACSFMFKHISMEFSSFLSKPYFVLHIIKQEPIITNKLPM